MQNKNSCRSSVFSCLVFLCLATCHMSILHALKMPTVGTTWVLVLLYLCETSATYTRPLCENANGFYCPSSPRNSCPSRAERCTGDGTSNQCIQKTYQHCDYDAASGTFEVYRYTTDLTSSSSSSRSLFGIGNPLCCLGKKTVHQFITYRGLMYEFGNYLTRVQDPNDPNYEYNTRVAYSRTLLGRSTCPYHRVQDYLNIWVTYELCSHDCQDFVRGLGRYLTTDCSNTNSRRRRQSDEEFARYIFSIAGSNCTDSLTFNTTSSTPSASTGSSESNMSPGHFIRIVVLIAAGIAFIL